MKKIFVLGKISVARHLSISVFIILQVICILIGSNMLLSSYNQQYILIKPFSEWLNSDGFYVTGLDSPNFKITNDENNILDELKGEWERISFFREAVFNVQQGNITYPIKIIIYDNNFWNNYTPVMQSGKWFKSDYSEKGIWCVATPNIINNEILLPGANEKIKVNGIMGNLCYIPIMTSWNCNSSIKDNFYKKYSYERDEQIFILMPESQWKKIGLSNELTYKSRYGIILPKHKLSEEEKTYNDEVFRQFGSPQIPMSKIKSQSRFELNDNLRRFLPLLIAQITITLFGIICASAIQTFNDEKLFSIYGLCGMNRKKRLMINLSEYGLLMFLCGAITYIIYFITKVKGKHAKYGLLFSTNNIMLSVALIILLIALSITAPYIITRKKCLADQLRRNIQ